MTVESLRKQPKQARSQQRVNQFLDAAAQVFAEIGYEAATTNAIAARANLPIGSLYQFFSNKEALLDALVERYTEQMQTLFDAQLIPGLPLRAMIGQFVGAFMEFEASHVAFKTLFMTVALPSFHAEIVQRVEQWVAVDFPALIPAKQHTIAAVFVAIVKGLLPLTDVPANMSSAQVSEEIVTALLAYIRAVLIREGQPLPQDLV